MLLPKTDCVLSFAGQTYDAYPLMLQAANAIETFNKLKTRSTDLADLKGHLLRPLVLSGNLLPGAILRSAIKAPASPFGTKPKFSSP